MEKQISIPQLRFPEFKDKWNEEKMGEIYSFKVTNSFSRDNLNYEEGTVKNIHYGDIHTKFQTLFDITKETVPFINSDISIDRISEDNYCKEGDLILADASEDLNDVGKSIEIFNLNNEKLLAGLHTILARPNLEKLDIGFGGYLFKSNKVRTKIQKEAQGSKVLSISATRLTNITLDFPSKDEQKKIVECFSSIDEKIQSLKKKHSLLEQYKKGVMQKLFSQETEERGSRTPLKNNKKGEQLRFKDENGNDFPEWEVKKLGEIGEIVTGKTPSTADLDLWDGEIQFVTPTDITENKYQFQTQRTIKELPKTRLLPLKSIMFTCIASIGKMSLSITPCVTNQQINSIIPFSHFDNEFVYYALLNIVDYIKSTQSTNTLPIINKTEFSKFEVNIPKDKKEQTAIANFLSALDEKINQTQMQIEKMEVWKKGLLQKMFC